MVPKRSIRNQTDRANIISLDAERIDRGMDVTDLSLATVNRIYNQVRRQRFESIHVHPRFEDFWTEQEKRCGQPDYDRPDLAQWGQLVNRWRKICK